MSHETEISRIAHCHRCSLSAAPALGAGQAEGRRPRPRISPAIAREVGGDRIAVDVDRARLSGSALRRSEAELHPQAAARRPARRRRPRAGDRLAAAAHSAEPEREDSAGRRRLPGRVAAARRILDIPQGQITRAMGDVHPLGNPHYWLDPENGKAIARAIAGKLSQLRPNDKAYFDQRLADFTDRLDRGGEAVAGRDGAVQGHQGRHLPPLVIRTSPTGSASTSSATSSRGRAFRRLRSTRSIWSTR